jgi:cytosine/adenosine deaminase-related metal-dependent hydrolase
MSLEMATRGGAGCLGRVGELGEISVGAVGDVAVWSLTGPSFAGAVADPVEAWLRCGPTRATHTVVHGRVIVRDGRVVENSSGPTLESMVRRHNEISARIQGL